jgi:hypothetical protein
MTILLVALSAMADDDDFSTVMMRATVKLQHDRSTATGFVLRQSLDGGKSTRSVLVTGAHVLEQTPGVDTTVVYRVGREEGGYQKRPQTIAIRKDNQPIWTRHPTEDVAAMVVAVPDDADLPQVSVDLLASDDVLRQQKIHPGTLVSCLGYPHRTEANEAGFAILRTGPIASYPLVPAAKNKTFLLSTNTFEGDSGGPIFLVSDATGKEQRVILGLMHGQHFLDEEMVMIYGTQKQRHRLGLGIVVQATFIRETIELLPKE